MSEFKLQNAKEAEERISQVIIQADVDGLTQDWVSLGFEIKRLRRAELNGLLMLEALKVIKSHAFILSTRLGYGEMIMDIAQTAIDGVEGSEKRL